METFAAIYCAIFFILSIRNRTKKTLGDFEFYNKWYHISTFALPALIFPRCFVNDPTLSTVIAYCVSFIEGFQYILYVTTKPKGKTAITLRSEVLHILRPLSALYWIASPITQSTFLTYCLFSTIDAVIDCASLCIPLTADTIFFTVFLSISAFSFGFIGLINAAVASTAMIYRSQRSFPLASLSLAWGACVLYTLGCSYYGTNGWNISQSYHEMENLYSPRFDHTVLGPAGAATDEKYDEVTEKFETCGWKTRHYPFPWEQKKALITQNSEVFGPALRKRGFQVSKNQYDVQGATFVWGKNKRIWRFDVFKDLEGSFRLGPLTVGMSKMKDSWLLMNHSSEFKSQNWEIPQFFLIRNTEDVEKLKVECSEAPKEIFFWKVDGKHSGSGVFPMTGEEVLTNIERWKGHNRTSFVQKAVPNLALIHGSKFDVRTYILIASWEPFLVYYYKNHYLRRSLTKFTKNNTAKAVHLTNLAVFKQKYLEDDAVWHFEKFKTYVEAGNFDFDFPTVERNLKETLFDVSTALHAEMSILETSKWWFANFACDFMVDQSGRVHFIEFVWLPAMSLKTPMLKKLKTEYAEEILNIQFEIATKQKEGKTICPQSLETVCDFELVQSWDVSADCG